MRIKQKEFDKITKEINAASFRRKRKCFITECPQTAIQSHLLQRNGVLNQIVTNGHLYEVTFLQFPKGHYIIRKTGWNDALTFHGFCPQHDSKIFEPIEKGSLDLDNYKSLLLLSYRPLLQEYRLKEIVSEAFTNTMLHEKLSKMIDTLAMKILIEAQTLMMWDVEFLLLSLQEDLAKETTHYKFHMLSLPKVDICTSIVFSYQSLADSFKTFPQIDMKQKEPIASMLFHLIPAETDTKLILGYHIESEKHIKPKVEIFENLNQKQLLKKVSDTLIKKCGTWVCSEDFYLNRIEPRKSRLLNLMNHFTLRNQFSNEAIDLNLFE